MRSTLLTSLLLVGTAFGQDKPAPPPQQNIVYYSAVEKAIVEQFQRDGKAKTKEAAKLIKRQQKLQTELNAISAKLAQLNGIIVDAQKVRN